MEASKAVNDGKFELTDTYIFDTQSEVDAFFKGVEAMSGWNGEGVAYHNYDSFTGDVIARAGGLDNIDKSNFLGVHGGHI